MGGKHSNEEGRDSEGDEEFELGEKTFEGSRLRGRKQSSRFVPKKSSRGDEISRGRGRVRVGRGELSRGKQRIRVGGERIPAGGLQITVRGKAKSSSGGARIS